MSATAKKLLLLFDRFNQVSPPVITNFIITDDDNFITTDDDLDLITD